MANDRSGRPAHDARGKLVKPKLTGFGLSKAKLAEMATRPVDFTGSFCLTGVFAFGSREDVEQAIRERGGTITEKVTLKGCTVVVGTAASAGWVGGNYGRKIEDAVECIKEGRPVTIITEDVLAEALLQQPGK